MSYEQSALLELAMSFTGGTGLDPSWRALFWAGFEGEDGLACATQCQ